jgi:ABC-type multidrug transport system fused ATPase/permease subunit
MGHMMTTLTQRMGTMPKIDAAPISLGAIFRDNKGRMFVTYALFNLENILRLAQPFVLGIAIDGLLKGSYVGLACFVAQHLAHLAVSSLRQMYDTRSFTTIYTDLATKLVVDQRARQVEVSRIVARSAMSRSYVEFFETHVPTLIRAAYSIVGALVMLGWYDWSLIPLCVGLVIPASLLNAAYRNRTLGYSKRLHDELEREVDVIRRGSGDDLRAHYNNTAEWRIRLSDAEAINFSVMELFVLVVMVGALVHYCSGANPNPGDIFAVFRYVLMFIMGLDSVPKLVAQMSRLSDIGSRMGRSRTA